MPEKRTVFIGFLIGSVNITLIVYILDMDLSTYIDSGYDRSNRSANRRVEIIGREYDLKTLSVEDQIQFQLLARQELKKIGYEPAEMHRFKSPYIINPTVYSENISALWSERTGQKTKIISVYNIRFNKWYSKFHDFSNTDKCKYKCEIDFSGKKSADADMLIFICKGFKPHPLRRPPGQLWAMTCFESPVNWSYQDYHFWKDGFNLTMTHRLDSDIVAPYFQFGWRDSSLLFSPQEYRQIAEKKNKTAVWWVSNCYRERLDFVHEMQKYIDIDIFGACGMKHPCSEGDDIACLETFNTTYKFYIAFENSFCVDYVTEKFSKTFMARTHIIPVVKGGADYDMYFPNNTFVNGNLFINAKELALHLKDLANDLPRYSRMLQQKDRLEARDYDFCNVCESLHTKTFGIKRDIHTWSHVKMCKPHEFRIK